MIFRQACMLDSFTNGNRTLADDPEQLESVIEAWRKRRTIDESLRHSGAAEALDRNEAANESVGNPPVPPIAEGPKELESGHHEARTESINQSAPERLHLPTVNTRPGAFASTISLRASAKQSFAELPADLPANMPAILPNSLLRFQATSHDRLQDDEDLYGPPSPAPAAQEDDLLIDFSEQSASHPTSPSVEQPAAGSSHIDDLASLI
jgi:hypothetical protein